MGASVLREPMVPTGDGHRVLHFTPSSPDAVLCLQKDIMPVLTHSSALEDKERVGYPGIHSLVGV